MSASFAKHNDGNLEYKGPARNQTSFLDMEEYKLWEISGFLFEKYKGQQMNFLEVALESIKNGYAETFVRKTLSKLEREGKVKIIRIPPYTLQGRERRGIEEDDIIVFEE